MSLRDSLIVALQTLISNGFGASVGLEAGYTQIGLAAWPRASAQSCKLRRADLRVLVGCGAAAAIAAAFGAPLTGAFYAFELVDRRLRDGQRRAGHGGGDLRPCWSPRRWAARPTTSRSATIAAVQTLALPALPGAGRWSAPALGIAMMRGVALIERGFDAEPRLPYGRARPSAAWSSARLALITPQVLSAGPRRPAARPADQHAAARSLVMLIGAEDAGLGVSLGSGFRGGLFFASLLLGALVRQAVRPGAWPLAGPDCGLDPTICALVGMGALAVAIVGGPLTMTFLVLETTGDFAVTGAVLAACVRRPASSCARPSATPSRPGGCTCAARRSAAPTTSAGSAR